jgi:putative endonuclease
VRGFTKQYDVHKLMYFEIFDDPLSAITREKQLKRWSANGKFSLSKRKILIGSISRIH